jgi:hypothetical protein
MVVTTSNGPVVTGKILWETEIEGNPDGIPAVYEVDGRQYVAFYAAGGGGMGSS